MKLCNLIDTISLGQHIRIIDLGEEVTSKDRIRYDCTVRELINDYDYVIEFDDYIYETVYLICNNLDDHNVLDIYIDTVR